MKKITLKTLLVSAVLCMGSMSAWAVDVPIYNSTTGFYELNSVNYFKKTFDFTTLVYGTTATAAAPMGFSGEGKSSHRYQTTFNKSTSKSEMPLGLTFRNTSSSTLYLVLSNYGLQINGTGMYLYVAGIGDGSIAVLNYYVGDAESTTKISDKELQTTAIIGDGKSNYFELTTRDSYYLYTSVDIYFKATAFDDFTPHTDGYYYKVDATKYERTTYDFTSIMRYGDYNSNTVAGFNDTGNRYKTSFTLEQTNMPTGLTFSPMGSGSKQIYYIDLLGMQSDGNVNLYPTARDTYTTAYLYYKTGTADKVNFADVSESNTSVSGESLSFSLANKNSEYVLYTHMEVFNLSGGFVSATIGATGYATFASTYPLDLSNLPDGLTAYYVSNVAGEYATLSTANTAVPAGEGLLLKGTANTTYSIPVVASGTALSGNKLVGVTEVTTVEAGNYVFGAINDGAGNYLEVGFHVVAEGGYNLATGKAYLNTQGGSAKLRFVFDDDASSIKAIATETTENAAIYNLGGQRVNAAYKGIVIKNGKKYLVR